MLLAAAQLRSDAGNVESNIAKHLALIEVAVDRGADLVFFPELSLTGYEPKLAMALAADLNDRRFDVFQACADAGDVAIGVGFPGRSAEGIRITMAVFQPKTARLAYAKQQLHADEMPFFVQGSGQLILNAGSHVFAPAICYESLQDSHASVAAALGANVYLASVAKPKRNVLRANEHYAAVAKRHSMAVLMANSVGPSDDFVSAGQSAVWNASGELLASMDDTSEGLVTFDASMGVGSVVLV
jgi:predicted amidohydrolase